MVIKNGARLVCALAGVLLVALLFRFYALDQAPPGLHYDEAIDAHLALDIRSGARPLYFVQGWGREPLYHYLVALAMNWFPAPAAALRITSALLGTAAVGLAFLLLREMFTLPTAVIGAGWLASSLWAVSISRLGVRDIALLPLATACLLALWRALFPHQNSRDRVNVEARKYSLARTLPTPSLSGRGAATLPSLLLLALAGLLLGLCLYTYQASRSLPLLAVLFVAYLGIICRDSITRHWKGLILMAAIAALVAAPLAIYLWTHPQAESGRNFQSEPVQALLKGQPGPILAHGLATLKMFHFYGDPQPLYNVPGRPALALLAGIAMLMGLIVAVWRFRQPAYGLVLLWLAAALLPALITFPAPHFPRTLLAQIPVATLVGLGAAWVGEQVIAHLPAQRGWKLALAWLVGILVVGQTAWQTWNDYFIVWANLPQARFQYNAGPAAAARYLDASPGTNPVVLAGLFADDSDPYNFEVMLRRQDLDLRWFNASSALPIPAGAGPLRLVLYDFTPVDSLLQAHYLADAQLAGEESGVFSVLQLDGDKLRAEMQRSGGQVRLDSGAVQDLPVRFGDLSLLGFDIASGTRDQPVTVLTRWQAEAHGAAQPIAIFIHLVDAQGKVVAQDDRLGYPHHGWQPGDVFAQVHHIEVPGNLAPGEYDLWMGVYYQDTLQRLPTPGGDRVMLGHISYAP